LRRHVVARPNIARFADAANDKVERLHQHHGHDVLVSDAYRRTLSLAVDESVSKSSGENRAARCT
jgi:hypothetical protein